MDYLMSALEDWASALAANPTIAAIQAFVSDNWLPLFVLWCFVVVILINSVLHQLTMEAIEEINRKTSRIESQSENGQELFRAALPRNRRRFLERMAQKPRSLY